MWGHNNRYNLNYLPLISWMLVLQPEELSPPEPTAMDIDIDAIHTAYHTGEDNEDSPDSDADADEDSDELNEDEPPEAMGSRSGRGATTTQQTHRNAGTALKKALGCVCSGHMNI